VRLFCRPKSASGDVLVFHRHAVAHKGKLPDLPTDGESWLTGDYLGSAACS